MPQPTPLQQFQERSRGPFLAGPADWQQVRASCALERWQEAHSAGRGDPEAYQFVEQCKADALAELTRQWRKGRTGA